MAGAGYKLFNTGDVLTAAQVNTYLQEQVTMVFADAAARTTALSGVLAEGMITYLKSDKKVYKYNGSAWVEIVAGSASPLTTKGDLYTYSTTDARLAVGNNGETLLADSSQTTGLRWGNNLGFTAGKNKIINGDFGIWQRGTSITTGAGGSHIYTADRWLSYFYGTNTSSVTQQTFTAGTAPVSGYEGQYFGRFSSTSTANFISYRVEDVRTLANQASTLSFWVKSNANQTLTIEVNQNFGSGGSATTLALSTTQAVTTSWVRYSFTFTPGSLSGKTIGTSSYVVISISGAINNAVDLWGVQWEAGSVATPFQTATGTLAGELAACQRYYQRIGSTSYTTVATGLGISTTIVFALLPTSTTLRGAPTVSQSNMATYDGSAFIALTGTGTIYYGQNGLGVNLTVAAGLTISKSYLITANNNAAGYIELSSEL